MKKVSSEEWPEEINCQEFFERNLILQKRETIENIISYLHHHFPAIQTVYIDEKFILTGTNEQQLLRCQATIKEILSF